MQLVENIFELIWNWIVSLFNAKSLIYHSCSSRFVYLHDYCIRHDLFVSFQFISGKSHKKKKKKKKNNSESGDHDESTNSVNTTTDASEKDKSESPKKKKKKKKKSQNEDEADSRSEEKGQKRKATENGDIVATTTPAKKANFNIEKLKEALGKTDSTPASASKANTGVDDAKSRLKSSQFRFLNEKLYSQNGAQSLKMFSADKVLCHSFS